MGKLLRFPENQNGIVPLTLPKREELVREKRHRILQITIPVGVSLRPDCHVHTNKRIIVIEGCANIELSNSNQRLLDGDISEIPMGNYHRIENAGKTPLIFLEVRLGAYLEDDDILTK